MDDFVTGHGCKSGCHFFPSCSEVNSKGYLEFDEPISARLERYPLFSILTSDIASLKVFSAYPCFQVKIYVIEMFVTVPPVGRCTKQLTSSRWIFLGSVIIIIVLEGGQKLAAISDIASLYKKW